MRIGTRSSALALTQTRAVVELLGAGEIVTITTSGDRGVDGDSDKSRWVDAIEAALLAGEIDLAVHSAKDLPGELAEGLELLGTPAREDPRDVLCGASDLNQLASGARIGSSSVRRRAQLRGTREDLEVVALAGNVDTRLKKLATPTQRLDAIVLALAGLRRLAKESQIGVELDLDRFLPCPGQGALALQGRAGDERAGRAAAAITDPDTFACLRAERSLARGLQASCHTPLGALAQPIADRALLLRAWVGLPDGSQWLADRLTGDRSEPDELGRELAARMRSAGASALLARAQEMTVGYA